MPGPLNILHVFPTFKPGGSQVRTIAIVNAMGTRAAHTFLAMDGDASASGRINANVRFQVIQPPPHRPALLQILALWHLIGQLQPNLVITYNWGAIESVAASIARLCPVVHTEDGFGTDEAVKLHLRRVWARRILLPRAYCTVVPSRTLLKITRDKYRLPAGKVRFIVNGVDTDRFHPSRDPELRAELGCDEATIVFGYVGSLRAEKNIGLLLDAFARARIDNSRVILIGDGDKRRLLEEKARDLAISDRVVFTGEVSQPARYLAAVDVFTMSSVTEQMPLSLLEAMACGLPVICTDVGDSGELAGGIPPAVVPSGDLEAYTHSIRLLAGDAGLRQRLGDANRQRCLRDFTLDRMVREYEEVYFAAAGRSRSEPA